MYICTYISELYTTFIHGKTQLIRNYVHVQNIEKILFKLILNSKLKKKIVCTLVMRRVK